MGNQPKDIRKHFAWKKYLSETNNGRAWFILTNLEDLQTALSAYQKRFSIEKMFRYFKSGGYSLEQTYNVAFEFAPTEKNWRLAEQT